MVKQFFICLSAICAVCFVSCQKPESELRNERERAMLVGRWDTEKFTINGVEKHNNSRYYYWDWYQFNADGSALLFAKEFGAADYTWTYQDSIIDFDCKYKVELLTQTV